MGPGGLPGVGPLFGVTTLRNATAGSHVKVVGRDGLVREAALGAPIYL